MELDQFQVKDPKEFFDLLVHKALEGKSSKFEFIRNYQMLQAVRLYKKGVKKVAKVFESIRKDLLKRYETEVTNGTQQIEMLMSVVQFEKCRDYYRKELAIAKDMIKEYRVYVESGHIIDTLLGRIRPDTECVDYRKLPIKWF